MSEQAQVVTNDRGRFIEQNPRFCELVGRPRVELQSLGWEDLVHPEDWIVVANSMNLVLTQGGSTEAMVRVVRPEGLVIWMDQCFERLITDDGTTTIASTIEPFTSLFPEAEQKHGIELILEALATARNDRDCIFDALEDMRSRTMRMAGAFAAMAGVAQEREGDPDDMAKERLNRTMAGAQAIAESVQSEVPDLERRPRLRN